MKIASTSRRFISPLIALTRASVIRLPAVGSNVFAISLSSAARQPKGRGYSRKPRSGHRPPDRKSSSQKLDCRAPPSSFSRAKGGRVFTIAVVSIRRRLPLDSRHVRGNASACSRFFPSSIPLLPSSFDSARGNCSRGLNTPCQSHSRRRRVGNVGYVGRATKLIDAVIDVVVIRASKRIYIYIPTCIFRIRPTEMAVGKFAIDTWNRPEIDTDMGAVSMYTRWANDSRVNNEAVVCRINGVRGWLYIWFWKWRFTCWFGFFFVRFFFFFPPFFLFARKFVVTTFG